MVDPLPPAPLVAESEYREITLADIVRVMNRRKWILAAVFVLVVLGGVGVTALTTPEYESEATIVPLAHGDIIENWLESRRAAELVVQDLGQPLLIDLFPDRWDAGADEWANGEPSLERAGRRLAAHVTTEPRSGAFGSTASTRLLVITATLTDPIVARDVAASYVRSLDVLRPNLVNITMQQAFDQYYDGQNEQAAQRQAEATAEQMDYWIPLDAASTPTAPSKPNVMLNLSLAAVLGLVLGVFVVFFWEWLSKYRADAKRVEVAARGDAAPVGAAAPAARVAQTTPGRRRYG